MRVITTGAFSIPQHAHLPAAVELSLERVCRLLAAALRLDTYALRHTLAASIIFSVAGLDCTYSLLAGETEATQLVMCVATLIGGVSTLRV